MGSKEGNNLSKEGPKDEFLKLISRRIDQHMGAVTLFENIRWRFITSFGIGAFIALFASASEVKEGNRIIAVILVIIVSIAGIISQIRIFGLMINLFYKIRRLQQKELEESSKKWQLPEGIKEYLYLPNVENKGRLRYLFTVHIASCFVFSSLIGAATYLLASLNPTIFCIAAALIGGIVLIICFAISYLGTVLYVYSLKKGF